MLPRPASESPLLFTVLDNFDRVLQFVDRRYLIIVRH